MPSDYQVAPISEGPAKRFVVEHHYSRSYPAALQRFGLLHGEELVGVAVLGAPASAKVLTNAFPGLDPYSQSAELSRFVLLDEVPANAESWFLARVFRAAHEPGLRGVVSFSDPLPRRTLTGDDVLPGHVGIIYQATNAIYTGRATARLLTVLPDGTVLNDRSAQKIRRQEQGHRYAQQRLVDAGTKPLPAGDDPAAWLRTALTEVGARRIRHRGAHRYLFPLGSARERRRIAIGFTSPQSYPKGIDTVDVAA